MASKIDNALQSSSPKKNATLKEEDHAVEDQFLSGQSGDEEMASSKSKDPYKPKRKKARRACSPCQRAHLTCSDERPCERCISRNRAGECHDGHRKKAKYLHDTPDEALEPGRRSSRNQEKAHSSSFIIPNTSTQADLNPPVRQSQPPLSSAISQNSQLPSAIPSNPDAPSPTQISPQTFEQPIYDINDPSVFNFDIGSMNFGNRYGALEFGMLGQMSTGFYDGHPGNGQLPPGVALSFDNQQPGAREEMTFGLVGDGAMTTWQGTHRSQTMPYQAFENNLDESYRSSTQSVPSTYAIRNGSFSVGSPSSTETSAVQRSNSIGGVQYQPSQYQLDSNNAARQEPNPEAPDPQKSEAISKRLQSLRPTDQPTRNRQRDPSTIYEQIQQPYPYTAAFHSLLAGIQRRFSAQRRLRIAQALASIRPSFISSTKNLTKPDLVFMEKCFQRGLWDYQDLASLCGTPTVICRRTGEVAYASQAFTTTTGWERDVLIGLEPNLNVNTHPPDEVPGSSGSTTHTPSKSGFSTPTPRLVSDESGASASAATAAAFAAQRPTHQRHPPVVLADLMDNESAVRFFEDYAQLAYADRGSTVRRCKLLEYRPKEDNGKDPTKEGQIWEGSKAKGSTGSEAQAQARKNIVRRQWSRDGKVDCMYCLLVKRDVFNMPMMMVVNFLPITG